MPEQEKGSKGPVTLLLSLLQLNPLDSGCPWWSALALHPEQGTHRAHHICV